METLDHSLISDSQATGGSPRRRARREAEEEDEWSRYEDQGGDEDAW